MALSRGSDGSFQLSRGGCNAEGGHVFAGLEGLATTLVLRPQSRFTREPSLALQPRGDHETAKSLPATRPGRTPSSPMLQRSQTSLRQQPQTLKEKSELLKNISVHGPTFTLIHDLYTPNRSYIFGETTNSGRRAAAEYEKEAADQLRQRRIWSYEDKIEKHKQRIGEVHRSGFVRTKKALPTKSSTPISRQLDGTAFPAEPSAESSMLALLGLAEDGVPNELIGPFRNESYEAPMLPAVKQVSTFEDYLERMMKQVRAGPVRFDKSIKDLDRRQFRPSGTRSILPLRKPALNAQEMVRRAERAATSLGFAPSREVVNMHRSRPHWQIDPSIYVRAYMED